MRPTSVRHTSLAVFATFGALSVLLAGCPSGEGPSTTDSGRDGSVPPGTDAGVFDAGMFDSDIPPGTDVGIPDSDVPPGTDVGIPDAQVGNDTGLIDGEVPDIGPGIDAFMPGNDAAVVPVDANRDAFREDGSSGTVTQCPGASLPPLAGGAICEATAGNSNLLITGDILVPDGVLEGGQVLLDDRGTIVCAGCDCSGQMAAMGATRVTCPDGVVSPGLINAHEHLSFQGNPPADTGERYEHRHDWRRGIRGHTRIGSMMATRESMHWAELRMVMSGATSVNGSGGQSGWLRNLDRDFNEGLGQPAVEYDTFPLGDSSGLLMSSGCMYGSSPTTSAEIMNEAAYTPHISEGIDDEARNEFVCLSNEVMNASDLIASNTALIHGIALRPADMEEVAADGAMLIWSPRSNIFLYGDTARVREFDVMGVRIALGSDWIFSGSMNMSRELQCADFLNQNYFGGYFSDVDLWRMATLNGAVATATDDVIGAITPGRIGDLAIFDGRVNTLHRAVIAAQAPDVALVLRAGVPLYGEAAVVAGIRDGASCDMLDVCGAPRRACAMREYGMPLMSLRMANASSYPLFFCPGQTITNEPSCLPQRPRPMAMVDGSTVYTGTITGTDGDGDGIADASDNCPTVFNPIRPMDGMRQADADDDMEGDSCDPCPLDANTDVCSAPDPNDRDRDMVDDAMDNCPGLPNMSQSDRDNDGKGDDCDQCPDAPNRGSAPCPATIYQVKNGTIAIGTRVVVSGVVTAVATNGFFVQVPEGAGHMGYDYSGVFVFTGTMPTVMPGQLVSIDGPVSRFPTSGAAFQIQFSRPTVMVTGMGSIPAPVVVTDPATIATNGMRAAALEGVLVEVRNVSVTNPMPTAAGGEMAPTYEFEVTGGLRIDDLMFRLEPFPTMGETFAAIRGPLMFRSANMKIEPRSADDVVAGTVRLLALEPVLSYVRVGASMPTFPDPLRVRLTRAAAAPTMVTITSSAGATVADVTIPMGASSAVVPVAGMTASSTPVTITASLGGDMVTSMVRVLGANEQPGAITLTPPMTTLRVGVSQQLTVTTDIPAPPGGSMVMLTDTTGGMLPMMVLVPADETTATFMYTAPAAPITGMVTATLGTAMDSTAIEVTAGVPGTVIINEIDYDQSGTDSAEFIELYNPGISAVDLTGVSVVLVNGSGGLSYATANLSGSLGPDQYLVIGVTGQALALPMGVVRVDIPSMSGGSIQNGAPDGVVVVRGTTVLDRFTYEGVTTSQTYGSLAEGTPLDSMIADPGNASGSFARIPNGTDTNDHSADWELVTRPTPGASNDGI